MKLVLAKTAPDSLNATGAMFMDISVETGVELWREGGSRTVSSHADHAARRQEDELGSRDNSSDSLAHGARLYSFGNETYSNPGGVHKSKISLNGHDSRSGSGRVLRAGFK